MANPAVRKRLVGDLYGQAGLGPWDGRKTGSAAIECAFVAAGLLQVTRFVAPNIWDVAGGIALARASGASVFQDE
jgi:myo-inositol-1(or 4)-monophosphatase